MKALLFAPVVSAIIAPRLLQAQPAISKRGLSPFGGYALFATPCPAGTDICGTKSCCPTGYKCFSGSSGSPTCCPDSNDCTSTLASAPACADNSWDYYNYINQFCCPSDTIGAWTVSQGIGKQCIAKNIPVIASVTLTKSTQRTVAGATSATGTATGGSGVSTTGTSTGTGAGAGTVTQGSSPSSTSDGSTSSDGNAAAKSANAGLSQAAIIAIAVLATVVGMLVLFVSWLACTKRIGPSSRRQGSRDLHQIDRVTGSPPKYASPAPPPHTGATSQPDTYRYPTPVAQNTYQGNTITNSVYESDSRSRVELDAHDRR